MNEILVVICGLSLFSTAFLGFKIRKLKLQINVQNNEVEPTSFLEKDCDEENKNLLISWDNLCGYKKTSESMSCQSCLLNGCVSGYCHRHCPDHCKCGAGEYAKELIKEHGTLTKAHIYLKENA